MLRDVTVVALAESATNRGPGGHSGNRWGNAGDCSAAVVVVAAACSEDYTRRANADTEAEQALAKLTTTDPTLLIALYKFGRFADCFVLAAM